MHWKRLHVQRNQHRINQQFRGECAGVSGSIRTEPRGERVRLGKIRGSKLWLPGAALALLPGAVVLPGLGVPPASAQPAPGN
jgi:hypothetical protein